MRTAAQARTRLRATTAIFVALTAAILVLPAGAAAGPVEETVQHAAQTAAPVGDAVRDTAPAAREVVRRSVASAEPTVRAATEPVSATVAAVTGQAGRVVPGAGSAVSEIAGQPAGAPSSGSHKPTNAGAVDRHASRHAGGDSSTRNESRPGTTADVAPLPPPNVLASVATDEQPATYASSTTASDDDRDFDGGFPLGGDGGASLLAGPAGLALLAIGLLAALIALAPRFTKRRLQMTPGHRRPSAFLLPIERPG